MLLCKMSRYWIAGNKVAIVIIHIDAYLTILGLIEKELQCSDFDNNKRIRLRLTYIKF